MNEYQQKLDSLYQEMEKAYDAVAKTLDFTCTACPDNCCDSYFLHHTYIEWAYLWEGFLELPAAQQEITLARAQEYVAKCADALSKGERPMLMCPLNDHGRCTLYKHRLLICRLHGIPASISLPNGMRKTFPGCFRCQEIIEGRSNVPMMERTKFFQQMVDLEKSLLGPEQSNLPRLKKNIAEMLVSGPPPLHD